MCIYIYVCMYIYIYIYTYIYILLIKNIWPLSNIFISHPKSAIFIIKNLSTTMILLIILKTRVPEPH